MIKGIDKSDHEHLLHCLEELRALTRDADEAHRIRMDINTLTNIYERYSDLLQEIAAQSLQYHSIFRDIQVGVYKQLRQRRKRLRATPQGGKDKEL